ncbi:MAG: SUF system NifU family Fe-S cluster assembly protein [Alphaproteobacteria bacterium]|nr:SUF system NifU family Fe-S cluster assembly protein [Alphaproteobacteria bacterium]
MSELRELYQEVILDHNKRPRNYGPLEPFNHKADGHNPLCGDNVTVYLEVEDGIVKDLAFEGRGCAISVASASMMTELVKGKPVADAERLFDSFHHLCTDDAAAAPPDGLEDEMDSLQVLSGVREFPMRVKCATLAWHTMHAALHGEREVSTE